MRIQHCILLAVLLVALAPVFSSCGIFGKSKAQYDRELYEQQIQAIQQQQAANQKAQEEYNQQLQNALNQWSKQYADYQNQVYAAQGAAVNTDNQSSK